MNNTIVVYGSTTGTCEAIAQTIGDKLGAEVINVSDLNADVIASHDNLILGTSTWGFGELQDDWYDGVSLLSQADLSGKKVAIFGCGDSEGYSDSFCGGMREIADACGCAQIIGQVATEGYTFDDSAAVDGDHFVGLALDDVNESDKTESRIEAWIASIQPNL